MHFDDQPAARPGAIAGLNDLYLTDEAALVSELAAAADPAQLKILILGRDGVITQNLEAR